MASDMELQGMDELLQTLQSIDRNVSKIENNALKASAQPVAEEMRDLVVVSSIDHEHIRDDIQVSGIKSNEGVKYVEIGPGKKTNWRAKFLEFGTSKMPAKPFVQIAYEHKKQDAVQIIAQEIREELGL